MKRPDLNTNFLPAGITGLYIVAYLCLLPYYQYQINPDAVSYIACAQHYAHGELYQAINGYWSPLLSWLLLPFIKAGIQPLMAIKLINLYFSARALYAVYLLAKPYISKRLYLTCLLLACMPHLLIFSLTASTPDILSLALLLLFLLQTITFLQQPAYAGSIRTGLLGALCYFAKYYNFYGILLLLGITACYVLLMRKKELLRYIGLAAAVFLFIAACWIGLIYAKYGILTPTTSSAFNTSLLGQPAPRYPFLMGRHLLPLDYNQYTYTSWEDPFDYHLPKWSPLSSATSFSLHLSRHIVANIRSLVLYFPVEILLGIIALLVFSKKRNQINPALLLILSAALLYPVGYMLTILEHRYICFTIALILVSFFASAEQVRTFRNKSTIIVVLTALLLFIPLFRMYQMPAGNKYYKLFGPSSGIPGLHGQQVMCSRNTWSEALYLCYFNNGKLHDALTPELIDSAFVASYPRPDLYFCVREEIPEILRNDLAICYIEHFAIVPLHSTGKSVYSPFSQSRNARVNSK